MAKALNKNTLKSFFPDGFFIDFICSFIVSTGVLLALRQLFRFENPTSMILLRTAIVLTITVLVTRRWWYTVLFVFTVISTTSIYLFAIDGFEIFFQYVKGFFNWWVSLFPVNSEYNTLTNTAIVHWLITIWVCVAVFLLIRCIKSLYVIVSFSLILFTLIVINGFRDNISAICLIIAGSLPLLAKRNHNRLLKKFNKVLFTKNQALAMALAVSMLCTIFANRILPKDTSSWRNPAFSELLNRISDSQHRLSKQPFDLITSGLQPNVERLGGDVELGHRLVLRVKTDQPALMKGNVYNIYTGKGWQVSKYPALNFNSRQSDFAKALSLHLPRDENGENPLFDAMPVATTNVTLMFGGYTFYYSGRIAELTAKKPASMVFRINTELFSQSRVPTRYSYSFKSIIFNTAAENISARIDRIDRLASRNNSPLYDSEYEKIAKEYLQLPGNLPESVIRTARQIAGRHSSNFRKVTELEKYLKTNFEYTLKPGDVPEDADFVEHFLNTQKGYCTYFASAMAVMCRVIGVPTRFVIGYGLVREGKNYAAYTDNAHAWVECYFRGVGWITFDPTAGTNYSHPVTLKAQKQQEATGAGSDATTEAGVEPTTTATTTTSKTNSTTNPTTTTSPSDKTGGTKNSSLLWILVAGIAAVILAATLALRVINRKKAYLLDEVKNRFSDTSEQIDYYYTDILRQLRLLGLAPETGETILQHGKRSQIALDNNPGLPSGDGIRLMKSFGAVMNWRYGNIRPSEADIEDISNLHGVLEERLKNSLSPVKYFFSRLIL